MELLMCFHMKVGNKICKLLHSGFLSFSMFFNKQRLYSTRIILLFIHLQGGEISPVLLVYVDDVILASNYESLASQFKSYLDGHFKIKGLRELKFFLGLEVARNDQGISMCQENMLQKPPKKMVYLVLNELSYLRRSFDKSVVLSKANW